MKIIDGHELAGMIKKTADQRRDSGLYILAGLVTGFVNDMPEAEAYTEAKKRIENMEKIIEDQQERIDIMAADCRKELIQKLDDDFKVDEQAENAYREEVNQISEMYGD